MPGLIVLKILHYVTEPHWSKLKIVLNEISRSNQRKMGKGVIHQLRKQVEVGGWSVKFYLLHSFTWDI